MPLLGNLREGAQHHRRLAKYVVASLVVVGFTSAVISAVGNIDTVFSFQQNHPLISRMLQSHLHDWLLAGCLLGLIFLFVVMHQPRSVGSTSHESPKPRGQEGVQPSGAAEELAEKQRALLEKQNELLEVQFQPQFRFVKRRIQVGEESIDTLELWNDGAPIQGYNIYQRSYIEIERDDVQPSERQYVSAFYFIQRAIRDDAQTGLLVTFYACGNMTGINWQGRINRLVMVGGNNTKEYERLAKEVSDHFKNKVRIKKRVFLIIFYADKRYRTQRVTYEIYPETFHDMFSGPAMPIFHGRLVLQMMMPDHDLRSLTAENLLTTPADSTLPIVAIP